MAGVPIAVPVSCNQVVSPKEKILLVISSSRTCKNMFVGKSWGMCSELQFRKSRTAWIPVSVSMFVYIDVASAEKTRALSGKVMCFRYYIISKEFFT